MSRKWIFRFGLLALLILLLAGCGGSQNPYKLDTGDAPIIFDGFWDGLTAGLVLLDNAVSDPNHDYTIASPGIVYWLGWAVGLIVFVYVAYAVVQWILGLLPVRRRLR